MVQHKKTVENKEREATIAFSVFRKHSSWVNLIYTSMVHKTLLIEYLFFFEVAIFGVMEYKSHPRVRIRSANGNLNENKVRAYYDWKGKVYLPLAYTQHGNRYNSIRIFWTDWQSMRQIYCTLLNKNAGLSLCSTENRRTGGNWLDFLVSTYRKKRLNFTIVKTFVDIEYQYKIHSRIKCGCKYSIWNTAVNACIQYAI